MFNIGQIGWYNVCDNSTKQKFGKVTEMNRYKDIDGYYDIATILFEDNSKSFLRV